MLAEMGNHRACRLTYDRGVLEITMPSDLHEFIKRLLERIVTTLTEELDLDCEFSVAFSMVSGADLLRFLEEGQDTDDDNAVMRSLLCIFGQQID